MRKNTITEAERETFVAQMSQQMADLARAVSDWFSAEHRTLAEAEEATLQAVKGLGNTLLSALLGLLVPAYPEEKIPCPCGHMAEYERMRCAQIKTLLGTITLNRPYYLCSSCHHGSAPLDQQLEMCAGGFSAGLEEVLALLGAQGAFEEAVALLQKLTLVEVCPNSCQSETETLGQTIAAEENQAVAAAWTVQQPVLPAPPETVPERLYVSVDGTTVHTREEGWKEIKLGAFYTTRQRVPPQRPDQLEVRAQDLSFYADLADAETFGRALWVEGVRRGVMQAKEVVAVADGAHWIWNLVEEHFPGAVQIVDWYHASEYVWKVAHALYGEGTDLAKQWAKDRLDELWAGKAAEVLRHFQDMASTSEAAQQAVTYYTNNLDRMQYALYRAKGLQIGSGSIESGCKHVLGARLKQAGMIWNLEGARAVAKVRTRLKSGRWEETIARRSPPHRSYQRKAA
jgi:hypothetical protein